MVFLKSAIRFYRNAMGQSVRSGAMPWLPVSVDAVVVDAKAVEGFRPGALITESRPCSWIYKGGRPTPSCEQKRQR